MKEFKSTIIALIIFIGVFALIFCIYKVAFKRSYVCTDATNNVQYTFDTKEEMDAFCDNLSSVDDSAITSFSIYNDLINNNDSRFSFYPYFDSNNKLTITVVIIDCVNPNDATNKANEWFSNHSYNINDYNIEYEYPCE